MRILIWFCGILLVAGCSSPVKHLGERWDDTGSVGYGTVSKKDSQASDAFIEEFHGLLKKKRYSSAFEKFQAETSRKISVGDFAKTIQFLDVKYGAEQSFEQEPVKAAANLDASQRNVAATDDGFKVYQAVGSQYASQRRIKLTYFFRIGRNAESNSLQMLSMNVYNDEGNPVFVLHPVEPVLK